MDEGLLFHPPTSKVTTVLPPPGVSITTSSPSASNLLSASTKPRPLTTSFKPISTKPTAQRTLASLSTPFTAQEMELLRQDREDRRAAAQAAAAAARSAQQARGGDSGRGRRGKMK